MHYKIKTNGGEYEVHIRKVEGNMAHITVNDVDYDVEVEGLIVNPTRMSSKPTPRPAQTAPPVVVKPTAPKTSSQGVKTPLPGLLLDVCVKEGDNIKTGQELFVLEAMKMENSIQADRAGVVEKIYYAKGDTVLEGDVILDIK